MSVLTAEQLNSIASNLLAIGDAIDDYLDTPPVKLQPAQITSLGALRDKIFADVATISGSALSVSLDDAANAVTGLNKITANIDTDIAHLTDVQKVINAAGAAVNLAVAIIGVATDPGAIPGAVGGVIDAIKAFSK
ncbi:MAG TPA: hypothetical protein VGS79_14555 [Puia sp.]|nr:hypothetical protein [Puia sp.]